jgi:drug/metabolite transporter (DMT)-like permease
MTAAFARRSTAAVAAALATVYLVWGSTYLAIRVTDRTMPPFLMSSVRFLIAGAALYAFASRGRARARMANASRATPATRNRTEDISNGGIVRSVTRIARYVEPQTR